VRERIVEVREVIGIEVDDDFDVLAGLTIDEDIAGLVVFGFVLLVVADVVV
jgi:hypothetical protein